MLNSNCSLTSKKHKISNIKSSAIHKIYRVIAKYSRKYELEVDYSNLNNIEGPVIFSANHSNAHDFYTAQEIFYKNVNVLGGSDDVDKITYLLFSMVDMIFCDRRDKTSRQKSVEEMKTKLANGNSILLFPESTWNIHPSKLMLPLRMGIVKIAAESGKPIIPIIFEYIDNDIICKDESEMFTKCIVRFGDPIHVSKDDDYEEKLNELRDSMATIRWGIWEEQGQFSRDEIDINVFINHDQIKTHHGSYIYDWQSEQEYIYGKDDYIYTNYPINKVIYDENGVQVLKKLNN